MHLCGVAFNVRSSISGKRIKRSPATELWDCSSSESVLLLRSRALAALKVVFYGFNRRLEVGIYVAVLWQ